ncbi:MAG: type II toxin-antitoxin system Phd/YefM family antitoxin [Candidatus Sulfotelmatobacter sp.]
MKAVVHRIPLTKARINLGQVVRRVHVNREYFILEKDGIPVVGLMHVDDLEDYLELQDSELSAHIAKSNAEYREGKARDVSELLAELKTSAKKKTK